MSKQRPRRAMARKMNAIHAFIIDYTARVGYPPTEQEIAIAIGAAHASSVCRALDRLVEARLIERPTGKARGIVILSKTFKL